MSSSPETHDPTKPVETIHPDNLPEESKDPKVAAEALHKLVDNSSNHDDVESGIHSSMHKLSHNSLLKKLVPGLEDVASKFHVGNYVMNRETGEKFFEGMPIYPRLGMHLLYYGGPERKILHNKSVETVLKDLSIKQGKSYDSPESIKHIPSFIKTYSIQTDELLEPDINKYKTFNDFFYRKLKPDARPVQSADNPAVINSAADCRLTVYHSVDLAKKFWIKGNNFSVPNLLGVPADSEKAKVFDGANLAVFRLAPADYHRFHSPIDALIGETFDIPGEYYTVNPQAVNEPGFDVFTANKRSVLYMIHQQSGHPVAFVAIGAMLVGSIVWTAGCQNGTSVKRGEELGYFAYGGSTVVVLFPKEMGIKFDDDLVKSSDQTLETYMKVGWTVGTSTSTAPPAA